MKIPLTIASRLLTLRFVAGSIFNMADEREASIPSSLCTCPAKKSIHVHCACYGCKGKAVNYRTQLLHLSCEPKQKRMCHDDDQHNQALSTTVMHDAASSSSSSMTDANNDLPGMAPNCQLENDIAESDDDSCAGNVAAQLQAVDNGDNILFISTTSMDESSESVNEEELALKHAIIKCIFHAIEMSKETGSSLNSFESLLSFARHMFCLGKNIDENDPDHKKVWPKTWKDAQKILMDFGYEDAKEYFICLNASHPNHWDIMNSESEMCRHCGEKGKIKYYYLGLNGKLKLWFSNPEMCEKMASHWKQRDSWMHGRYEDAHVKNEVWDGSRFAELSWFWNPEGEWLLPARCVTQGCNNIIAATSIEALPDRPDGRKEIYCDQCCSKFLHQPKYVKGDPRNIAYIGHWDGFQPFCSKCRSTGAIEVSIATMAKKDRLQTEEVYTVGFVPSYDLPDGRPNSIDPFLEPLIQDLEDGFIEGYKVQYAGSLLNATSKPIDITIRHLLLLWTGDHPAQCEVCKTKGAGGKKACRRCHICGSWIPHKNHNYYPGFRKQYRYPCQKRVLADEFPVIKDIEEEERPTYFKSKSKEHGYNGLSIFYRLYPLYGFNFLTDTVIDAMHILPLNVVKNHLERLISAGSVDKKSLNSNLSKMPWTTDDCASRLPRNIEAMGSWKAEEFQKFAFPASEVVLNGLLCDSEYELWAPIPRMVELVFNCGRNGWTDSMIQNFRCLAWRYCILLEEKYGIDACVINLHNLTHLTEDIKRFSSPDNYWCFDFERAVKRYVHQSSNKKRIEKSFARRESQREFMKFNKVMREIPSLRSKGNLRVNREKVTASSLEDARSLYLRNKNEDDVGRICSGVMIGASHLHILTDVEMQTVQGYCSNLASHKIDEAVESYKSIFLPLHCMPKGKLYRKEDIVYTKVGDNEVVVQIKNFYLLEVDNMWKSLVLGSPFEVILSSEHGNMPVRHPLSDNVIVHPTQHTICFAANDILRQVMLYPDATLGLTVVDPMRENVPVPQVLVPMYPESGDFVSVYGDNHGVWIAQVVKVNYVTKNVEAYFYVKHNNFIENKLWVKEKPGRKQVIHFDSILNVREGSFIGTSWKEIDG